MAFSNQPEFQPLLPAGFHRMSLEQLEALCVTAFPRSKTRRAIFDGLLSVISEIHECGLQLDVWIDGSFMTQKENPNDSDIVIPLPLEAYELGTPEQRSAIEWINSNLKESHLCDSYLLVHYPGNHPKFAENEWNKAYWIKQFGFSRGDHIKGIAVFSPAPEE